jgi:hypothetical protein
VKDKGMPSSLYYRRQFLLANETIEDLPRWQHQQVGDTHLYVHPDLELTEKDGPSALLRLMGHIFDPADAGRTNRGILSDISLKVYSFQDLIVALKPYTGCYAILYRDDDTAAILNDPLGVREIYYCTQPNRVICASQPNLIDAFSEPKLGVTRDRSILDFYANDMKHVRSGRLWVGDETYYCNVKHLMPNHYLDLRRLTAKRYWPNRKLERLDLKTAVRESCEYLKGVLRAITSRYKVMIALTSGLDSRSLLAASKDVRDRIYYFINKEPPLNEESGDIRVARNMAKKLNIPFHVHDVEGKVDEEFRKVFLNNTFMSTELILPTIYNVYYKKHQDKVNLLGVGEVGREYYGEAPGDLDGYYLARCLKYRRSRYATAQCEKWLEEARGVAEEYNVDIMKLFLWEGLLGNWGVVGNSESDIAIEEFDPYDSHYIYEIMLSVDPKHTKGSVPDLFKAMYEEMWPELLDFPFNPPDRLKDKVMLQLQSLGVYKRLKRGVYKADRWRFDRFIRKSRPV